jgi:hypothetical protein
MTMATEELTPREQPERRHQVPARFTSRCGWCQHLISPRAEEIAEELPDGRWVHEDCAEDYYAGHQQPEPLEPRPDYHGNHAAARRRRRGR